MLALTDRQLHVVMDALRPLSEEQRMQFLGLLDAQLRIRTIDLESAVERAADAVISDAGSQE